MQWDSSLQESAIAVSCCGLSVYLGSTECYHRCTPEIYIYIYLYIYILYLDEICKYVCIYIYTYNQLTIAMFICSPAIFDDQMGNRDDPLTERICLVARGPSPLTPWKHAQFTPAKVVLMRDYQWDSSQDNPISTELKCHLFWTCLFITLSHCVLLFWKPYQPSPSVVSHALGEYGWWMDWLSILTVGLMVPLLQRDAQMELTALFQRGMGTQCIQWDALESVFFPFSNVCAASGVEKMIV